MRPYCRAIRHFLDCHGNYKLLEEALRSRRGGPVSRDLHAKFPARECGTPMQNLLGNLASPMPK